MKKLNKKGYRVVGRINKCPFVIGFRRTPDMQEWIDKGWDPKQINFIPLGQKK